MIIVIEGGDQAGKKTQSELLVKALRKNKIKTKLFSFPDYSTPIGNSINNYLKGKIKLSAEIIHILLAFNRREKLSEILKAEKKYSVIVMNRYYQSNLVYGLVNGLKLDWLESLDEELPKADLVIILDTTQKDSFNRKKLKRDQFEKNKKFYHKVLTTYRTLAKKKKWRLVDASQSKEQVHKDIMKIFAKKLQL